jgi:hypothetical protein
LVAGVVAWWRRPSNRVGTIMVFAGLVMVGDQGDLVEAASSCKWMAAPFASAIRALERYVEESPNPAVGCPCYPAVAKSCRNCPREFMPSFPKIWARWYSTALELI